MARLKTDRDKATIIAAYAPEEGKIDEFVAFYDTLQKVLDLYNNFDQILLKGDLNNRVGNVPIPNIVGSFGENMSNENGKMVRDFATFNGLKITNTFFRKRYP